MKVIKIRQPIWKDRSIGIAVHEFPKHDEMQPIGVEILYRNKAGIRLWPNEYMIRWVDVQTNPRQTVRGVELVIIKIGELRIRG